MKGKMQEVEKKSILIKDGIYGEFSIDTPVLVDLIKSPPLQRIKRINQFGIPNEFYHKRNFSRYDHCVGVMLLLRSLGASEEEQAAGLLHDVSHMAFSHVYDWVIEDHTDFGPKREEAQDNGHFDFIQQSEIPQILARHRLSPERITDYHYFTLLEADLPNLCADRVDYSLRELPVLQAREIFAGLKVANGQIVCKDFETAAKFGRAFLGLQREHWGGYEAVARYTYFSTVLKESLKLGVITQADFLSDDEQVVEKLKQTPNSLVFQTFQILRENPLKYKNNHTSIFYKKFRFIDPPFITGDELTRLTQEDGEFRQLLDEAREENEKGVVVPNL